MTSWTQERSTILSLLLDDVVGTEEMINIRRDFCLIQDCFNSSIASKYSYYTGSRAEGLELPGSDNDYMYDCNNGAKIRVIQEMQDMRDSPTPNILHLCTENVPSGFAMLKYGPQFQNKQFLQASRNINGVPHLSSYLLLRDILSRDRNKTMTRIIQGPSIETWTKYMDTSEPGTDTVCSIHCPFWPGDADEWLHRSRNTGWPTPHDIASIVDFGFYLVPIGHPFHS